MNDTLTIDMAGTPSSLREICSLLDPSWRFPVRTFCHSRFGDYDAWGGQTLTLTVKSEGDQIKIVHYEEQCLNKGYVPKTMVNSGGC